MANEKNLILPVESPGMIILNKNFWINVGLALLSLMLLTFLTFTGFDWYTRHGESQPVPDLKGMQTEDARRLLESSGLQLVVTDTLYELPDSLRHIAPGAIADQQPIAGREVKEGRKIYVSVRAMGPPMVVLPELLNTSLEIAKQELESLGFRIKNIQTSDGSRPKTDRNPPVMEVRHQGRPIQAGTKLPKGEWLDLIVDPLEEEEEPDSLQTGGIEISFD